MRVSQTSKSQRSKPTKRKAIPANLKLASSKVGYLEDILDIIFSACVINDESSNCDVSRLLSQTCGMWRDFITNSPKYWTSVSMHFNGKAVRRLWTRTILERSQTLPLTLHLRITAPFELRDVTIGLYPHLGRVRKFIVDCDIDGPPVQLWHKLQLFMQEQLELFDYRQKDGMRVTTVRKFLSSSDPPFDSFHIPLTGCIESEHLKWSTWQMRNITSLTLDYIEPGTEICSKDVVAILSRSLNSLEHLSICDSRFWVNMFIFDEIYTFPKLTSLSIKYVRAACLVPFVDSLNLPSLIALSIRDVTRVPESSTPAQWRGYKDGVHHTLGGGLELLTSLQEFRTVTHMECYGVRTHDPPIIMGEMALEYLTLVDSDDVFRCLVCMLPTPRNGWRKNNSPSLTRSGMSLQHLAVTSNDHELFVNYLEKRQEAKCAPLRELAISPCCLHSAYAAPIQEKNWKEVEAVAGEVTELAGRSARDLKMIRQPESGTIYDSTAILLKMDDGVVDQVVLSQFLPDMIENTDDDESADESGPVPFDWVTEECYMDS